MKALGKKRIFFYLRNSLEIQHWEFQKQALQNALNNRNDVELVKVYAEKISGYSGEGKRPEMEKLLSDVRAGLVDELWAYDVKRVSRNSLVLKQICEECKNLKVNIFFLSENLNLLNPDLTPNPMTSMILSLLGEMAEQDGKQFIEKGIYGKLTKARSGEATGGVLPVGYTYLNAGVKNKAKTIVVDDNRKKVVEYIFNAYANENKSLGKITNELNNLKLIDSDFETPFNYDGKVKKNNKGEQWAATVVMRILKCTWYSEGFRLYKGEKITLNENLKFIDSELWQKANQLLSMNKNKVGERTHQYLIKDLIYCSCGQPMKTKQLKNLSQSAYECYNSFLSNKNKLAKCEHNTRAISVEKVENAIWLLIKNKLPEFIIEVETKSNKEVEINEKIDHNNQLIAAIQTKTITELKETRQRTVSTYAKFGGDENELDQTINSIDNQLKDQNKLIAELKSANKMLTMSIENLDIATEIEKNIKQIEADKSLIKMYLSKLIKKIVVGGGLVNTWKNVIKIVWNDDIKSLNDTFLFFNSRLQDDNLYYFISSTATTSINWNVENKTVDITEDGETINLAIEDITKTLKSHYWKFAQELHPWLMLNDFPLIRKHENLPVEHKFNTPVKAEAFSIDLNAVNYEEHTNYQQYNNLLTLVNSGAMKYKFYMNMGVSKLEIVTPFK